MYPLIEVLINLYFMLSGWCWSIHGKQLSMLSDNDSKRSGKLGVSKRLFIHFYATALIMNAGVFLWELCFQRMLNFYRIMFGFHACRRYFEQLVMFNKIPASRMHFVAYLFGLSYYVVVPIALCNPLFTPYKIQLSVFILSQLVQFKSHYILYMMKRDSNNEGTINYKVPTKAPFNYLLCPHYLSEILVYIGLICNVEMASCTAFVCIAMTIQALHSKQWYTKTFKASELKTKYALFPYIL